MSSETEHTEKYCLAPTQRAQLLALQSTSEALCVDCSGPFSYCAACCCPYPQLLAGATHLVRTAPPRKLSTFALTQRRTGLSFTLTTALRPAWEARTRA